MLFLCLAQALLFPHLTCCLLGPTFRSQLIICLDRAITLTDKQCAVEGLTNILMTSSSLWFKNHLRIRFCYYEIIQGWTKNVTDHIISKFKLQQGIVWIGLRLFLSSRFIIHLSEYKLSVLSYIHYKLLKPRNAAMKKYRRGEVLGAEFSIAFSHIFLHFFDLIKVIHFGGLNPQKPLNKPMFVPMISRVPLTRPSMVSSKGSGLCSCSSTSEFSPSTQKYCSVKQISIHSPTQLYGLHIIHVA